MDDASLGRQLADLAPADIDPARNRAVVTVADRVADSRATSRSGGRRLQLRVGGIAAVLSAGFIAFAAWTGPGQAVTAWAGEHLGFGEPGGPPTLDELRSSWNEGTAADGQPAYVVASGPAPHSGRYEFIAYRARQNQGSGSLGGEFCFELNLIQERSSTGQGCGVLSEGTVLFSNGFGGGFGRSGAAALYTSGRASTEVASIEVQFAGRQVDVEFVSIPTDLLARLRIETPFKFFIAFLPDGAHGGALTISARDHKGKLLSHRESLVPDLVRTIPDRS